MDDQTAFSTRLQHVVSRIAEVSAWLSRSYRGLLASTGLAAFLLVSTPALAVVAVAPTLGAAAQFGVLGNTSVTGSAFPGTVVNGNVGSAPTGFVISNFPPSTVSAPFVLYTAPDPVTAQAHTDAATAYGFLAGQGLGTPLGNTLDNLTLTAGVYSSGAADLGGATTLTLNGPGIFVFNIASTLTMNNLSVVTGTANPCNVYWRVGSTAALNGTSFMGTVIADTSISTSGGGNVTGRLLAGAVTATGVVTMATGGNTIGGCSAPTVAPILGKAFSPATINAGAVSTLTVTLSNANPADASLTAALTDTLPGGVVIAAAPTASTTCGSGATVTAIAGASTVTLSSGSSIPANSSCTVTVNVTAAAGGSYINTLNAGALATSNGSNAAAAIATLTVVSPVSPPTLGKAFLPATINAGGISTLTVTLSNPDAAVATLSSALTDTLPGGVVIAAAPTASTTCGGGAAVTAIAGASTVTLSSGSSIPANSSCTLTVNVTAAAGGSYINTLNAGTLVTSNGNNAAAAVATLTVVSPIPPPTLGKAFLPATINAGGISTLTITLSNPDAAVATLTSSLTDTLPGGVVIAAAPTASTTCGGGAAVTAIAGASTVTLSSGSSIPATGSCTLTVNVTAAAGGSYINTLNAGALVTSSGNNAGPAIATLTVVSPIPPPTLGKAFLPATINAGGISTLTITLSNPYSTAATLSSVLTDTLPGGVVIAPAPTASTTCGGGAAVTAIAGANTVTLSSGSSIPATSNCTLTVNVLAAVGGSYVNTLNAGALVTSNGNNAAAAIATLTVVPPSVPPIVTPGVAIPTLSEWAMIMLAALLAIAGFAAMRTQAR